MRRDDDVPVSRWSGVQRRIRSVVPRPVRRADLAAFRAVARTELPVVGRALPRLSSAANHSRLWMAIAALLAAAGRRPERRAALRGLLAVAITSTVTNLPAKLLTGRVRPDVTVVPEIRRLARVPASTSFPSGHSASAFAFAVGASIEAPWARVPLLGLAGAVAGSRVYTGVHYPGDVLVGSAIGVAVARATTRPWPVADRTPAAALVAPDGGVVGRDGAGLVLVDNRAAGHRLARRRLERVAAALPAARTIRVDPGGDLEGALETAAAGATVLGIAGGDGSVNAAAAAARRAGVPLAVVPTGTLNHFAKDLGIEDEDDALRALTDGRTIAVDLGEIAGRTFLNATSVGAYPTLVAHRQRLQRRIGKLPATAVSLCHTLSEDEPLDLEIDGRRRRVWLLFVGNNRFTAEGIAPAHRQRLDDGALDVRVVGAERRWSRSRVVAAGLAGRLDHAATYERWRASELEVRSLQGPLRLAIDGETECDSDAFTVTKDRRSLRVLQPRPPAPAARSDVRGGSPAPR